MKDEREELLEELTQIEQESMLARPKIVKERLPEKEQLIVGQDVEPEASNRFKQFQDLKKFATNFYKMGNFQLAYHKYGQLMNYARLHE